jgi:spermidine synthase
MNPLLKSFQIVNQGVNVSEHAGVRFLHLDSPWVQGSMLIKDPFAIELEYVQRMMAWLLFTTRDRLQDMHAVQLGLGAAAITKFCYKSLGMKTTAIEINPSVVSVCRQWFKLPPENNRLSIVLADAGHEIKSLRWLGAIDALAVDLYDHDAAAPVLDSLDFYQDCRATLTDSGAMTVNLFGRHNAFQASLEKIKQAFGDQCVWSFQPTREGNTVVMATRTPPNLGTNTSLGGDTLQVRAQAIESNWGLPAGKWLKSIQFRS